MRGWIFIAALLTAFIISGLAFAQSISELAKEKPVAKYALPYEVYEHEYHEKPLEKEGIDCKYCHPFKLNWKDRTAELDVDYEQLFVKPLDKLCHDCHRKESRIKASVFVCTLCHLNTRQILPDDHRAGWLRQHGSVTYRGHECRECHDDSYCVDCHRRFELIRPRVHSRNYQYFHSIEARISPASCYACHRQSACIECHVTGKALR